MNWGGAPLWQLVRFADSVEPDVATGIESALQAANLLDGWVCPDEKIPEHVSEQFLTALPVKQRPQKGRTLADVLEVEGNADVPRRSGTGHSRVDQSRRGTGRLRCKRRDRRRRPLLAGAVARVAGTSRPMPSTSAPQHGRGRREARITEIDAALEELAAAVDTAKALVAQDQRATEPDQLCGKGIAEDEVRSCAHSTTVTESAGALRTRSEATETAQRELDAAIADLAAKEKQLRATASAAPDAAYRP